jgi:hypothetical protein
MIAACIIFISPGYLWYKLSKSRPTNFQKIAPIFYATLATYIILPVFIIKRYAGKNLVGVDIQTQQIQFPQNILFIILISILIGIAFYLLSKRFPERVNKLTTVIILTYFSYYIMLFFFDSYEYYIASTITLLKHGEIFLGAHLFIFFALLILLYLGGLIIIITETFWPHKLERARTKEQIREELLYYIPAPTSTNKKSRRQHNAPTKKNGK